MLLGREVNSQQWLPCPLSWRRAGCASGRPVVAGMPGTSGVAGSVAQLLPVRTAHHKSSLARAASSKRKRARAWSSGRRPHSVKCALSTPFTRAVGGIEPMHAAMQLSPPSAHRGLTLSPCSMQENMVSFIRVIVGSEASSSEVQLLGHGVEGPRARISHTPFCMCLPVGARSLLHLAMRVSMSSGPCFHGERGHTGRLC